MIIKNILFQMFFILSFGIFSSFALAEKLEIKLDTEVTKNQTISAKEIVVKRSRMNY